MNVKILCIAIHAILKEVDQNSWSSSFENYISELGAFDERFIYKKILAMYGGAGSFNDLVLYSNGKLCLIENNKLDVLRKELYQAIVQCLYVS